MNLAKMNIAMADSYRKRKLGKGMFFNAYHNEEAKDA
jgi:hypothetical protein